MKGSGFMKIYIEKENTLQIDEDAKLVLLNAEEFVANIKRESSFVPTGHIEVTLNYKLINNNNEYYGESIFDSYSDIKNNIDAKSPYKVELVNWKLSDKDEKYLEFNIEKKYPEKSYGIFVDINDLEKLKIYSHTYKNRYGNDPKRYSPIGNVVQPKEVATNWIIDNNSFKILKENISIWRGNNHDEENYVEKLVYETNFHYSIGDYMSFVCEKDGEQFTLIPSSKWIKINDEDYNIPAIEIYNYTPEKLGLVNINSLDIK